MILRKYNYSLLNMFKIAAAHKCHQSLINNKTKLLYYDNNNHKIKHNYLKKLNILNI